MLSDSFFDELYVGWVFNVVDSFDVFIDLVVQASSVDLFVGIFFLEPLLGIQIISTVYNLAFF